MDYKEIIKKEVEKLLNSITEGEITSGRYMLNKVLSFINSLPKEPSKVWHDVSIDDLPSEYASICMRRDNCLYVGEYRKHPKPLGELYDGDCNHFKHGDKWAYKDDIINL